MFFNPELKAISYKCIFDKPSPMSARVGSTVIYAIIRAGEIIDWWFPLKASAPVKTN